jgi:hypothetical protein
MLVDELEQDEEPRHRTPNQKELDDAFGFLLLEARKQYVVCRYHDDGDDRQPPKQTKHVVHCVPSR